MGRVSTVKRLSKDVKDIINDLRRDGHTLDEIVEHLQKLDTKVSRSALGRYVFNKEKMSEKLRISTETAEFLMSSLDKADEEKSTRANIALLSASVMRLLDSEELNSKEAMLLSTVLKNLTQAREKDVQVTYKIKEEVRKEMLLKLSDTAKNLDMSMEQESPANTFERIMKAYKGEV